MVGDYICEAAKAALASELFPVRGAQHPVKEDERRRILPVGPSVSPAA
jgi:hypothetical protein